MNKRLLLRNSQQRNAGFNLPEIVITTAIVATLTAIAIPNYVNSQNRATQLEAKATIASIPPIISAYVDATGEIPSTWDELSSIAAVMTNNGPASGDLNEPITLQNSSYELLITGPSESIYNLKATRIIERTGNPEDENTNTAELEDKYAITSCFNLSNGASDISNGNGTDIAETPNCG